MPMNERLRQTCRWMTAGLISFVAVAALAFGGSLIWFGSARTAWAHLNGQVLLVNQSTTSVGTVPHGATRPAEFAVRSLTSGPVQVIGSTSTCTCSVPKDLPLTIPPGQSRTLRFEVGASGEVGPFQQTFQLFLDVPSPPVILTATGEAAGHPPQPEGEPTVLEPAR